MQLCLTLYPPYPADIHPPLHIFTPICLYSSYFLLAESTSNLLSLNKKQVIPSLGRRCYFIVLGVQNLISSLRGTNCPLVRTSNWVKIAFQNKNQTKPNQISPHQTVLQAGNVLT